MIALDTNILVRFFTKDNPQQLEKVVELFSKLEHENQQAFIPMLVILETNWVLAHFYKIERLQIIDNLLLLFKAEFLSIENSAHLKDILLKAKNNTFDLSDLLIACRCAVSQHLPVMTFDKKASKFEHFQLLE